MHDSQVDVMIALMSHPRAGKGKLRTVNSATSGRATNTEHLDGSLLVGLSVQKAIIPAPPHLVSETATADIIAFNLPAECSPLRAFYTVELSCAASLRAVLHWPQEFDCKDFPLLGDSWQTDMCAGCIQVY